MGRLIDADVFYKRYCEVYEDGVDGGEVDRIAYMLSTEPTAYDVEKVVAELKDNCDIYSVKYYQENVDVKAVQIDDAIDIVRKGGGVNG